MLADIQVYQPINTLRSKIETDALLLIWIKKLDIIITKEYNIVGK